MADDPRETLAEDHRQARELVQRSGLDRTRRLLGKAQRELQERLSHAFAKGADEGSFTVARMRATLAQVRQVTGHVQAGVRDVLLSSGQQAAEHAAQTTLRYLKNADKKFRGIAPPLALEEAGIVDAATQGVRASILRRLASSGEPIAGADALPHPAKQGILERYGLATVGHFEQILQKSFVARTPWEGVKAQLTEASPFLKQAPAFWSERIVRTESMGTYNRAGWESVREADEQLGDMVKILSATFDNRTACLVAATRVAGAMVRAVFRRAYEGPATRIVTKSGRDLTATPNHPMLTRRGWVAAGELRLGDELVCDGGQERTGSARNKNVTNRPPQIGEVFETLLVSGARERRRGRQQDFYGDGTDRDVDVLRPNRQLRLGRFAAITKPAAQQVFSPTDNVHFCDRCGGLLGPRSRPHVVRFGTGSEVNPCFLQATCDECLREIEAYTDSFDRFAGPIGGSDFFDRHPGSVARMLGAYGELDFSALGIRAQSAARAQFFRDVSSMNIEVRRHIGDRHAGTIEFDRLVDIQRTSISGHVFDLSTSEGYFTAEGIYTGNSDSYAVHGQIRRPEEAFRSWYGFYQHPPNRPNDREIVVPHRISWALPPYLAWKSDAEVAQAWRREKRKGKPPARPKMTTVPLERFGR